MCLWRVSAVLPFPALFQPGVCSPARLLFRPRSRKHMLLIRTQSPSFLSQSQCRARDSVLFRQSFLGRTLGAHCSREKHFVLCRVSVMFLLAKLHMVFLLSSPHRSSGLVSPSLQSPFGRLGKVRGAETHLCCISLHSRNPS